jgi:phosphatidylinositol alpha-1,6-mannosyltransferase
LNRTSQVGQKLVIAGSGPQFDALSSQASGNPTIDLLGRISEERKKELLNKSDIFVLPASGEGYDVEGFGIVFLEAQAACTPVIGSSVGGAPEAIGEGGILLDDETNPTELAKKIDVLLNNSETRCKYVRNGEMRINEFDIVPICEEYVTLYKSIISQSC